jgi:hypothetical protein
VVSYIVLTRSGKSRVCSQNCEGSEDSLEKKTVCTLLISLFRVGFGGQCSGGLGS